ncbi:MAG TPA: glycolate oxidase subunit GlcF [Caulobacteraceae bacterium]|jgi:glycolate oxidase iron-sulfur subunit
MRAKVAAPLAETIAGARAEAVLRACVHCGMCNAVCPTFQLTGDELDGPRGRIYLIKGALEGEPVGPETLLHLDRCLECRACEIACPSGVEYHRLLDVGRPFVEAKVGRPWRARLVRGALRWITASGARFGAALALGRALGPVLPSALRAKLPLSPPRPSGPLPPAGGETGVRSPPPQGEGDREAVEGARRASLLAGCVQQAAAPHFNAAAGRVFARIGVTLAETPGVGCCGAVSFHLDAPDEARALARRNIDAWLADGGEAVIVTASGCAAFIKDYPDLLAEDPAYADKACKVAAMVRDPVEALEAAPPTAARAPAQPRIAVHDPCTLRHGLRLGGRVEALLRGLGFEPQPVADAHLCCGSAGPYSLLQPAFANQLRANKLAALTAGAPEQIVTANIGCWMHLGETSPVPVRHWLEVVDEVTTP